MKYGTALLIFLSSNVYCTPPNPWKALKRWFVKVPKKIENLDLSSKKKKRSATSRNHFLKNKK